MKYWLLIILFFSGGLLLAQDTRNAQAPKPQRPMYQAYKKEKKSFLGFLNKEDQPKLKSAEEEKKDFRKRVSKSYKESARIEYKAKKIKKKEAKKGEPFHGHKRPPKKRPAGKQKFCKICRIKH